MRRDRWVAGVVASMALWACSHAEPRLPSGVVAPPAPTTAAAPPAGGREPAGMDAAPPRAAQPPAQPPRPPAADVARARKLVRRGERLYRKGDYDAAERALKEAMTLYPFLANANVLLGKIFLIRGSASRDMSLIKSARLMFEMARALDPQLREAAVLLELFDAPAPE